MIHDTWHSLHYKDNCILYSRYTDTQLHCTDSPSFTAWCQKDLPAVGTLLNFILLKMKVLSDNIFWHIVKWRIMALFYNLFSNEGVKSSRPLLGKNAFNILQQMDQSGPVVVPYALIIFLNYWLKSTIINFTLRKWKKRK